ncbi:MAG: ornithine cyclodeaminase family protein [Bacteroidota bacterium]
MEKLLYLSKSDVEKVNLPMQDIIDGLEEMFKEKGEGRVEMPPKPGIHTQPDAFIHAMPAYIPAMKSAGLKWISGYPENQKKGLPYITGLLILNDPETGIPVCVMDGTWITGQRTGAASALSAKYMARKNSSSIGILACGVQGKSNLEAMACEFDIKKVVAYDPYPGVAEKFVDDMKAVVPAAEFIIVDNPKDAVVDLDIVVTSGPILKNPEPAIEAGWLKKGAFASAVDFDSYFQGAAFDEADKLATDDHAQMDYYRSVGYFGQTPKAYADLGEIVAGKQPGRENDEEINIAVNLGIALDDMATAIKIYKKAKEMGIGTELSL